MSWLKSRTKSPKILIPFLSIYLLVSIARAMSLFSVKLVDLDGSRLVATSGTNFGLTSPRLASQNWRTVSVNGDNIMLITSSGEKVTTTKSALGLANVELIENLRDELANSKFGYTHISSLDGSMVSSSSNGPGNFMMTSSSGSSNNQAISNSVSSSFSSMGATNSAFDFKGMNVNMRDENNFSVSKSSMPFNWSRVYFNGDLVTVVYGDGRVEMQPLSSLDAEKAQFAQNLKREVKEMQKVENKQFQNTMQHTLGMVSNMINGISASLPKPPSFESAIGNMFGNDFPFGPNNNPFSRL